MKKWVGFFVYFLQCQRNFRFIATIATAATVAAAAKRNETKPTEINKNINVILPLVFFLFSPNRFNERQINIFNCSKSGSVESDKLWPMLYSNSPRTIPINLSSFVFIFLFFSAVFNDLDSALFSFFLSTSIIILIDKDFFHSIYLIPFFHLLESLCVFALLLFSNTLHSARET